MTHTVTMSGGQATAVPAASFETRDPATGRVLASVPRCGAPEVDAAVRAARAAQPAWEALGAAARGDVLIAFADLVAAHADEEVFGPVLAVMPFHDEAEAVRLANGAGYDLAAAVWTKDIDRAFRIAGQVRAGQVHINSWGLGSGVDLPFGGIRFSGIGREKGLRALDEYSALRTTTVRVAA